MSLPAIARILELEERVRELPAACATSRSACAPSSSAVPVRASSPPEPPGSVVTLRHGARVRRATDIVLWRPRDIHGD